MNKKLVAQFLASVDPYTLPTNVYKVDELDEFETEEIIMQSVKFEHDGHTLYAIPGVTFDNNGVQTIDCFEKVDDTLKTSDYVPTYAELSDILEKVKWNGNWVPEFEVDAAMERVPNE